MGARDAEVRDPGRLTRAYARAVVRFRHVIVLGWAVIAIWAATLPSLSESGGAGGGFGGLVAPDDTTIATEIASVEAFGFPLISRTVLVQRDPEGLSPYAQAGAVLRAAALTQGSYEDVGPLVGALPITNTLGLFPSSSEQGTTALTYLFAPPSATLTSQTVAAREFADRHVADPDDAYVGVTGTAPARVAHARIIREALPRVEAATLAAIVLIVALAFRALAAPVVALGTAAIAFLVATRLAGVVGRELDVVVPSELEPLLLALLLGVVTDYAIFFMSGMRDELRAGRSRLDAARLSTGSFGPIVAVAGLTVAAGTAALVVAESGFIAAFGPAMAMTVLVSLVVSVTLVPAVLALLGRKAFWPALPREDGPAAGQSAAPAAAAAAETAVPRSGFAATIVRKPVAAAVALACLVLLAVSALPLRDMRLGVAFVPSLPETAQASTAADAAAEGFAPGILSPTVVLLQEDGIADRRQDLAALGDLLRQQPGVAGVLGPGDLVPAVEERVLVSDEADAARYLVVLDDDPLGAAAVETFEQLRADMPALLSRAGLDGVELGLGGDTALATGLVGATVDDLGRIATAALLVNLLLLILFLRALVAPLYLLACSVLALAAALGIMTFVFQGVLGHDGVTFYAPFAAAVLLLSLGSDYNIFGVGSIWERARSLPLRGAIAVAVPQTTRAISAAGITLAASFGMLAVVPLRPFRELALVMVVGILLDAFVVRALLVPALLTLVGPVSGWPGRALRRRPPTVASVPAIASPISSSTASSTSGALHGKHSDA